MAARMQIGMAGWPYTIGRSRRHNLETGVLAASLAQAINGRNGRTRARIALAPSFTREWFSVGLTDEGLQTTAAPQKRAGNMHVSGLGSDG